MQKLHLLALIILNLLGVLFSCTDVEIPVLVQQAYNKLPEEIDFNQDIKPILSDKCFICHRPDKAMVKAALQLHLPELAFSELEDFRVSSPSSPVIWVKANLFTESYLTIQIL